MTNLLTFKQVIQQANKPHLLLGNGFSMAYDSSRFSFTTLLQSAVDSGVIQKESEIYRVFEKLATSDFENVMRALKDAEQIVEVYQGDNQIRERMRLDTENLKRYLVQILTNNHPEKSTDLTEEEKNACLGFITHFDKIYTLNYDLLLYWATMQDQSSTSDGFADTEDSRGEGYVVYKNSDGFRVHYLHGALHYFDAGDEIRKKTYTNTDIPLVTQVRKSLDEGKYPVFVSEGSSKQKITKILHSAYLNHCYKSLMRIGGDLVIFGTTLKSNDEHILEAILQSKIKNIYLGVSSPNKGEEFITKIEEYNKKVSEKKKKKVYLYDYRTVDVWEKKS